MAIRLCWTLWLYPKGTLFARRAVKGDAGRAGQVRTQDLYKSCKAW
jgi:hypothetical protein